VSEGWLREVARDLMALGSVVFYVLVLGRALVGPYWDLAVPLTVAGLALAAATAVLRSTDLYLTRGLLVAVLVTRHYGDVVFGVFAGVAFVLMVAAALLLERGRTAVGRGVVLGVALGAAGYVAAGWFE